MVFIDPDGVAILELDCSRSIAGESPSLARLRERTIDVQRCRERVHSRRVGQVVRRHVHSLNGCDAPLSVSAIRSSSPDNSVPIVG